MANSLYRLCKELHKLSTCQLESHCNHKNYKDLHTRQFGLTFAPMPQEGSGPRERESARSSRRTQGGGTARSSTHGAPPVLPFIRNRSPGRKWPRPGDDFHLRRTAQTLSAGGAVVQIEIRARNSASLASPPRPRAPPHRFPGLPNSARPLFTQMNPG